VRYGTVQVRFIAAVELPLFVVNRRGVRHVKRKSVRAVTRRRRRVSGQRLPVADRGAGAVDRRVVAGLAETVEVARRPVHRPLPCRRRLNLAVEQPSRLADVISGKIQHGRRSTSGCAGPTERRQ